jgi:hypothetical protein
MKYKIKACVYHEVVDEFETDSLEEAREWWRKNWKKTEDFGDAFCEWYVDGVYQSVDEIYELTDEIYELTKEECEDESDT